MNAVRHTIHRFILAEFLPGEEEHNLRDDTPLLTSGILDSLAALNLANFLQERFHVEFEVHELTAQHFDRIQDIAAVIVRKQSQAVNAKGAAS
ncbi:MAG TPA: acyl carrier protein [Planctomycetota bacterium]|nr:acyl carrier protein [Planctomycetota bacterium]